MLQRHNFFALTGSQRAVLGNAIKVALVVGTLLNLINHGQSLLNGSSIEWGRILLNYCVPFGVSVFSATRAVQQRYPRTG